MGFQEIFQRLRHEVGCAEGVGQDEFEGGGAIVAEAVGEDQGDGRFAGFVIEAAGFETVLAIAIVDDGPLAFFSHNYNGAQKVVALGSGLLEKSADWEAIVEGSVVAAGGAIDFPGKREARGARVSRGGEESDAAESRFRGGLGEPREFAWCNG